MQRVYPGDSLTLTVRRVESEPLTVKDRFGDVMVEFMEGDEVELTMTRFGPLKSALIKRRYRGGNQAHRRRRFRWR